MLTILGMLIVGLPLIIWGVWASWHDKQIDKYNEWLKQNGEVTQQ